MDQTDQPSLKGAVLIGHQLSDGEHQYQVQNVVKHKDGKKMFVGRGDKLMQINGVKLKNLPPENLAQMLAEGNPMLTVHKAKKVKGHKDPPPNASASDTLFSVSKRSMTFSFSMELTREEGNEGNEGNGGNEGNEGGEGNEGNGGNEGGEGNGENEGNEGNEGGEGNEGNEVAPESQDGSQTEKVDERRNEEEGICGEDRDLLVVTMTKTSISVVTGRGCSPGNSCEACHGSGCDFDDVVMVSEFSTVTLVPRGSSNFSHIESSNASIRHVASHQYIRTLCSQKTIYASQHPERMTIYHYKSNLTYRGVPVVLNITGSNCFLRCCREGPRVFLQVEMCEKRRLRRISISDESQLAFLFYMKSDYTSHTKFESALHEGWFMNINTSEERVGMDRLEGAQEHTFVFVIQN